MNPSDENPEAADLVAQHLRQVAESERAPEHLRSAIRAQEQESRAHTVRTAVPRSARKGLSGRGARRPREPQPVASSAEPPEDAGVTGATVGRKRRTRVRTLALSAVLLLVVVVAIVRSAQGTSQPSVKQVAHLAALSPADPAPKPDPSSPGGKLTPSVQGLHFPNWTDYGGWKASGSREDELQGRQVATVFYKRAGEQIAYSIVAPPAIASVGNGADAHESFEFGGRTYVIWTVSSHTCMLSATNLGANGLWHLAQSTIHA